MDLFQVLVYAGLILSILFLISGFTLLIFGRKTTPRGEDSSRIEFKIAGQALSVPFQVNIILCIIGALLLYLTFDFYSNGGEPDGTSGLAFATAAYAQEPAAEKSAKEGWAYFGYEKDPELWNFDFVKGNIDQLNTGEKGIILKSKKDVKIWENHFGNLTGTVLNFLSPAPKVIGKIPAATCLQVIESKSVGFSKIWIKIKVVSCPEK